MQVILLQRTVLDFDKMKLLYVFFGETIIYVSESGESIHLTTLVDIQTFKILFLPEEELGNPKDLGFVCFPVLFD